jgi:hypothetical protein
MEAGFTFAHPTIHEQLAAAYGRSTVTREPRG